MMTWESNRSSNGSGNGVGVGDVSTPPNIGVSSINVFGYGVPFIPQVAAAGLKGILSNAPTFVQNMVGPIDDKMVEDAIRNYMGETNKATTGEFKETLKVDPTGKKYGIDIALGLGTRAENLKISRKENMMTINVKTEKVAEDGSSRLYQDYTKLVVLPENVNLNQVESSLSAEGVLSIRAPFLLPKPEEIKPITKQIPISIDIETDKSERIIGFNIN